MALYQQGNQKIEIIIKTEGGLGANKGPKGNKTKSPEENSSAAIKSLKTLVFGSTNQQRIHRIIKTNATHALAITKQVADLGIEYYIGGLAYTNGDTSIQEQTSRQMERFKDTTNIASSIGMGALYGSWGGPIGAVLGATFGGISSMVSYSVKYANRERERDIKLFKQENTISYKRARAQLNLTTGRLR